MNKSAINSLTALYSNQDLSVRSYVWARSRLLKPDSYLQYFPCKGTIVDVGCGYGVLANYLSLNLPDNQIIGIDMNAKRIAAALKTVGRRTNIGFAARDATEWAWPECVGIVMTAFLHHISPNNQELMLERASRSLKTGGVLLISEVDPRARPFYRYWASYLADRLLYPFDRVCFRTAEDWCRLLHGLSFDVQIVRRQRQLFAGVLLICTKGEAPP